MPEAGRRCDACGEGELRPFADLGEIPVLCGVHWADAAAAAGEPGRADGAGVPVRRCAYVRNVAFDPAVMVYDTTMDTNLHHSPAFQAFSAELVKHLADAVRAGRQAGSSTSAAARVSSSASCATSAGCTGVGYDAMYAGPTGPDPSGAVFHSGHAPRGQACPTFDMVTSPALVRAPGRPVRVPGRPAGAGRRPSGGRLPRGTGRRATTSPPPAGRSSIRTCRTSTRTRCAAWSSGPGGGSRTPARSSRGMFRFIEFSANRDDRPRHGDRPAARGGRIVTASSPRSTTFARPASRGARRLAGADRRAGRARCPPGALGRRFPWGAVPHASPTRTSASPPWST